MKKLIVTIICVLFASTSFAQMVGASSQLPSSKTQTKLKVKTNEFSISGGLGTNFEDVYLPILLKYKINPGNQNYVGFFAQTGAVIGEDFYNPFIFGMDLGLDNNNFGFYLDLGIGFVSEDFEIDDSEFCFNLGYKFLIQNFILGWDMFYSNAIRYDAIMCITLGYRF